MARWDFADPYHFAVSLSWPAFTALAVIAWFAVNLVFALLYVARPNAVENLPAGDLISAFFFSLETLATVGYGEMAPVGRYGHSVAGAEVVVGIAFTAILTGLLFVRFSRPKARILFADQAVITTYNGRRALMVRIANGRLTMLTGASAQIGVLLDEMTAEGQSFMGVHDLPLVRAVIPIFPLTWTLVHLIDEASPFHGLDLKSVAASGARLFVGVEAVDAALGVSVRALKDYDREAIVVGKRYGEAVFRDESGRTTADISRLSVLEDEQT